MRYTSIYAPSTYREEVLFTAIHDFEVAYFLDKELKISFINKCKIIYIWCRIDIEWAVTNMASVYTKIVIKVNVGVENYMKAIYFFILFSG